MNEKLPDVKRNWVIDYDQHPDVLIARNRAVCMSPDVHAAYARTVHDKAEREGVLYVDLGTGYRCRFKTSPTDAAPKNKAA
jgi:hypothetical protein